MFSLKSVVLPAARIAAISILSGGIFLITRQMVALSTATSYMLISLANVPQPPSVIPTVPTDAEVSQMQAISAKMDVIADNLENAETQGYKRRKVDITAGPQVTETNYRLDLTQGALQSTAFNLDVAIQGNGFFRVKISPDISDGTAYTRNGSFFLNKNGDLVLGVGEGYPLIPVINIPPGSTNIAIAQDGTVSYTPKRSPKTVKAGQIRLVQFSHPQCLITLKNSLYTESAESGERTISNPGDTDGGLLMQGYIEASNVVPVKEWVELIKAEQLLHITGQSTHIVDHARQMIASAKK